VSEDEEAQPDWPFAVELAAMPEVWATLLHLHINGRDGRCRGCRSQVGITPHWPCTLYRAAAQARRIAAQGPRRPAASRPGSGTPLS
jgi:hypothetical protein